MDNAPRRPSLLSALSSRRAATQTTSSAPPASSGSLPAASKFTTRFKARKLGEGGPNAQAQASSSPALRDVFLSRRRWNYSAATAPVDDDVEEDDVWYDAEEEQEEQCFPSAQHEPFFEEGLCGDASEVGTDDDEDLDEDEEEYAGRPAGRPGARWWDNAVVHPNGVRNWKDLPNLIAATGYECRCGRHCLSRVGGEMELYEFRRGLRAKAMSLGQGGLRDAMRDVPEQNFDRTQGDFRNTFRVGQSDDVCVMAFAVGVGISECTFGNARRDVTANRPRHAGRSSARAVRRSAVDEALDAWIRRQRQGMEGDKQTGVRWYYGKLTKSALWRRYAADRDDAQQPLVGDRDRLWKLWQAHQEILEKPPCGHDACTYCASKLAERDRLDGDNSPEARARVNEIDEEKAQVMHA